MTQILNIDFMKINLLTTFYEGWIKTILYRVYIRFYLQFDLVTYILTQHDQVSNFY